jgi:hypothetical protein
LVPWKEDTFFFIIVFLLLLPNTGEHLLDLKPCAAVATAVAPIAAVVNISLE